MTSILNFPKNDQNALKQLERKIAELERLAHRPDYHPYRNAIKAELEKLEIEYSSLFQFLDTVYSDTSNDTRKELKVNLLPTEKHYLQRLDDSTKLEIVKSVVQILFGNELNQSTSHLKNGETT